VSLVGRRDLSRESVAAASGGDVDLVSGRVSECPPRWRELVAYHAAARGERSCDAYVVSAECLIRRTSFEKWLRHASETWFLPQVAQAGCPFG
jgi:hypothetical protein